MKKLLGITLGIMTALGGFVDLGQIVFTMQAGALFGYKLLWTVVLGTAAIIVYMEMCGRIAVAAKEPVFAIVRNRLGFRLGLVTLIASNLLNVITCAAELGGIGIILHLLTGRPEKLLLIGSTLVFGAIIFLFRFQWIERTFGLWGLVMIVFAVSAIALHPDWSQVAHGLLPTIERGSTKQNLLYAYFAVGMFSALLMEYEVHFYSSGAMEEDWTVKDLGENFMVASLGSVLGAVLTAALLVLGVLVFLPRGIFPDSLSITIAAGAFPFGHKAILLALLGTMACLAGAAIETALSGAYNVCQFFNLAWGKNRPAKSVPVYTAMWMGMFIIAMLIAATGLRPLQLVDISIIFGMAIMPLTYYPILRAAADKNVMGKHVNSRADTIIGTVFLIVITIAAVAAIPLMIVTNSGRP
ncbi:MAG TPA: divalent metal cation transporter [Bryobacteraceae bacterium]|nr:divalent metal cation transporter [Bryobacteraceae bacterium]